MENITQIDSLINSFTNYQYAQTTLFLDNIGKLNLPAETKKTLARTIKTCDAVIKLALASTCREVMKCYELYKRIWTVRELVGIDGVSLFIQQQRTYEIAVRLVLINLDKEKLCQR